MLAARYTHVALLAEHSAIRQALNTLMATTERALRVGRVEEQERLADLLDFLQSFPEKAHRPKDERFVALLNARTDEAAALVHAIECSHGAARALLAELRLAARQAGRGDEEAIAALAAGVERYRNLLTEALRREEEELLPLAWKRLEAEDWFKLAADFCKLPYPAHGVYERAGGEEAAVTPHVLPAARTDGTRPHVVAH